MESGFSSHQLCGRAHLLTLLALLLFGTDNPTVAGPIFAFNCGSDESFGVGPRGETFLPDQAFIGGAQAGHVGGVPFDQGFGLQIFNGTESYEPILENDRRGWSAYRFEVAPGWYIVQMHFVENEHHWRGRRGFSVSVEGDPVFVDKDLWAEVERHHQQIYRVAAEVLAGDSTLDVTATAATGETTIAAIAVFEATPDAVAPPPTTSGQAHGGYAMNIVDWVVPSGVADLAGYHVNRRIGAVGAFERVTDTIQHVTRHIDRDVLPGTSYSYQIHTVDVWGNEGIASATLSATPLEHDDSSLPVYEIEIGESAIEALTLDVFSEEYVPCIFHADGRTWEAEVRFRGNATRQLNKKNWKIRFPDDDLFEGQRKVNLMAHMNDQSFIRDDVSYDIYELAGVLTPVSRPVHLVINGEFAGVYDAAEQIDEAFLEARGLNPAGDIFTPHTTFQVQSSLQSYMNAWEPETNEDNPNYDAVIEVVETANLASPEVVGGRLLRLINLESVMAYHAATVGIAETDFVNNNYLTLLDADNGLWQWINWDHSSSWRRTTLELDIGAAASAWSGPTNHLYDAMLTTPFIRGAMYRRLRALLDTALDPTFMAERIDFHMAEIDFDLRRDIRKWGAEDNARYIGDIPRLRDFAMQRPAFILAQLASYEPDLGPAGEVMINEVMPHNVSVIADEFSEFEPWLELLNTGETTVDLQGLHLSIDPTDFTQWTFPSSTLLGPGDRVLVWADGEPGEGDLHTSFRFPENEAFDLSLVAADGTTVLNQIQVIPLIPNEAVAALPDGRLNMPRTSAPTPNAPNTPPPPPTLVRINEVMAQNLTTVADEMGEFEPWLELHSREDSPLDLGGHYLTDRLTDLTRWEIPAGTVIPDGGHLLIWLDGETLEGPLHASIDFPSMGGLLILVAPDGQRIVDMVDAPAPSVDVGYGRYPDGSDNFFAMQFPTPGARNILTPGTRLLINEVLASNSMSGVDEMLEADDWIELYNPSDVTIDAAGLYLTDDITNQAKWQIPGAAGSSISPEGHLLIWIDDDENQGTFHASFNLSAAGESISLFDVDGMALIDSVAFGPQTTDASLARLPDGGEFRISAAPTPGASNVLALILQDIVDVILGIRGLTPPERAEADLDASGVIDAADLVGKINP